MPEKQLRWTRTAVFPLVLIAVLLIVFQYRESNKTDNYISIEGATMGTSYHIKYIDPKAVNHKANIDTLLIDFNNSLSTYIPDSEISLFNKSREFSFGSPYFHEVLSKSSEVFEVSNGAFDPTVMPLVNAWGFGFKNREDLDSARVDSLIKLVDFTKIIFDENMVRKPSEEVMLDFSAIAKGFGVDVVANYLESQGISNYMIEIGGEVRCKGKNNKDSIWLIGIDNPKFNEDGKSLKATVKLENMALATSGNYRNFYVKDGVKYAHTIDPKSGYPVAHSLLSASVFAADCMTADAYATAFMVAGKEAAIQMAEEKNLMTFLIYSDSETGEVMTYMSEELKPYIIEN